MAAEIAEVPAKMAGEALEEAPAEILDPGINAVANWIAGGERDASIDWEAVGYAAALGAGMSVLGQGVDAAVNTVLGDSGVNTEQSTEREAEKPPESEDPPTPEDGDPPEAEDKPTHTEGEAKKGYPTGTKGVIVSFYTTGPACEVEVWNETDYPIDVVTYLLSELQSAEDETE